MNGIWAEIVGKAALLIKMRRLRAAKAKAKKFPWDEFVKAEAKFRTPPLRNVDPVPLKRGQ
jgi:hypothetical protein